MSHLLFTSLPAARRWGSGAASTLVASACLMVASAGVAAPLTPKAKEGLAKVKKGDCVAAVPLLEDAELEQHYPVTAVELAECYLSIGELVQAADLMRAVADEEVQDSWGPMAMSYYQKAQQRAPEIEERVPSVQFDLAAPYDGIQITVGNLDIFDPLKSYRVAPDIKLKVTVTAPGYEGLEQSITLTEGEQRTLKIKLISNAPVDDSPAPQPEPQKRSDTWIGARFRGFWIPKFFMNAFGAGGTDVFVPGAGLTLTHEVKPDVDLVISAAYHNYRMGEVAFRPSGAPDTEYEILESDLQALSATLDLMVDIPLDSDTFSFRIGGALGIGWTFTGNIYRTQAYPTGDPDDPASYVKCNGPNDPAGQFRFCNQLDKDADRYNGYAEPNWFQGGERPLVYPYVALPQLGIAWYPHEQFAMDLEIGLSTSGLVSGLGFRVGL